LLDEPLSNLDAKLRTQMRSEISKLHSKIQTTFIYVTHDQVEAMTMGTRIVVMKDGFVQQIDTPRNLYSYPVNKFVAGFIGTPQMNFYAGKLKADGDKVRVTFDNTDVDMVAPYEYFAKADIRYLDGEKPVTLGIRLEHVSVDPEQYPYKAKCRVSYTEDLGIDGQVYADFNINSEDTVTESATKIIIKAPAGVFYRAGEIIDISMDLSKLHIFDTETEKTIAPRIPLETITTGKVKGGKLSVFGANIGLPSAIQPEDGEYELHIPTSAISVGGEIKAQFVKNEEINGQNLVQLNINGRAVFALAASDADVNSGLSLDLKQVAFIKDGEEVVKPLPNENELEGKIVKSKKQTEGENGKKVNEIVFNLEVAGKSFDCPYDVAEKIINGGGLKIFKTALGVRFAPDGVTLGEGGIPAHVERILDYGKEKFAECSVTVMQPVPVEEKPVPTKKFAKFAYNFKEKFTKLKKTVYEPVEKKVYIAVDNSFNGRDIDIIPDISKCGVFEIEQDIRLV
ncbi:MAG: ABC transporter ATP-binding protein, partial [Clostridia bacterium]|nr:ABC transporter ATP-binding protein [Clostridia bacterium]